MFGSSRKWIELLILFQATACSFLVPDPSRKSEKASNYSYQIDLELWKETGKSGADSAYYNPKSGNHLIINSSCKKNLDPDLKRNSRALLKEIPGLKTKKIDEVKVEKIPVDLIEGKGLIDGRTIELHTLTFLRNRCVYDFAITSGRVPLTGIEKKSFRNLIQTIRFD